MIETLTAQLRSSEEQVEELQCKCGELEHQRQQVLSYFEDNVL